MLSKLLPIALLLAAAADAQWVIDYRCTQIPRHRRSDDRPAQSGSGAWIAYSQSWIQTYVDGFARSETLLQGVQKRKQGDITIVNAWRKEGPGVGEIEVRLLPRARAIAASRWHLARSRVETHAAMTPVFDRVPGGTVRVSAEAEHETEAVRIGTIGGQLSTQTQVQTTTGINLGATATVAVSQTLGGSVLASAFVFLETPTPYVRDAEEDEGAWVRCPVSHFKIISEHGFTAEVAAVRYPTVIASNPAAPTTLTGSIAHMLLAPEPAKARVIGRASTHVTQLLMLIHPQCPTNPPLPPTPPRPTPPPTSPPTITDPQLLEPWFEFI